jgi:hypothetical protein
MRSMVEGRRDSAVFSDGKTFASLTPLHRTSCGPPPLESEGRN